MGTRREPQANAGAGRKPRGGGGLRLAALGDRTAALEQAYSDATRALETQISAASDKVDELAGLLEPLSAAVATADERIDAREVELQALEDRFHDASSRVESLVAELSGALAELPDPTAIARALEVRIDELAPDRRRGPSERTDGSEASPPELVPPLETANEAVPAVIPLRLSEP